MEVKSTEIYSELPKGIYEDEKILIQGVIDCYFEESNDLILIDYKTDYVTENNIEEIKMRYKSQLDYYEKALIRTTGKTVKEKYLYLFGKNITAEVKN